MSVGLRGHPRGSLKYEWGGQAMKRLESKVAVITGGGGGIGRAIAARLSGDGASVVVADIDPSLGAAACKDVQQQGGSALFAQVDISDEASVIAMFAAAKQEFGGVDILVNNAYRSHPGDVDVESMQRDVWMETMAINSLGPLLCCKHAIGHMKLRGGGVIINITSGASLAGQLSMPAYAAAKAATNMLTKSVATMHGRDRIRCNSIVPGMIWHPRLADTFSEEMRATYDESLLLPYRGEPADVAGTVAFLVSDDAKFITAQLIGVHGGLYDHHPNYATIRSKGKLIKQGVLIDAK